MAFFGKKKKSNTNKIYSNATIITEGTTTIGNFIGNDSVHIDGHIQGSIKVNNVVVIGKNGVVDGNIKAKQIISNGVCNGDIICDTLELLETSKTNNNIKANKILVKGTIQGNIICGGLFVDESAYIESNIQAKNVVTGGSIVGVVACKSLKILSTGHIKGKMFADRITNEGGFVEGVIGKYADLVESNPNLLRYATIFNSQQETALLQHSDYYVNIEEEVQKQANPSNQEDDHCIDVEFDIIDESKGFPISK